MKKTINYEKEIVFKTSIAEICSISLEHDFTVDDRCFKGDFILEGEYKTNELSVNKEPFTYHLPLEYEFSENVDYNSVNYEIENFEYIVDDNVLKVTIDLGIVYNEINTYIPPIINEDDLNRENSVSDSVDQDETNDREKVFENEINEETYATYHVHIVRANDTLESIAQKYGTTIDEIKKYNDIDSLELKSKLIIPDCENE